MFILILSDPRWRRSRLSEKHRLLLVLLKLALYIDALIDRAQTEDQVIGEEIDVGRPTVKSISTDYAMHSAFKEDLHAVKRRFLPLLLLGAPLVLGGGLKMGNKVGDSINQRRTQDRIINARTNGPRRQYPIAPKYGGRSPVTHVLSKVGYGMAVDKCEWSRELVPAKGFRNYVCVYNGYDVDKKAGLNNPESCWFEEIYTGRMNGGVNDKDSKDLAKILGKKVDEIEIYVYVGDYLRCR